jgi:DNA helicase-2/ATP-dependent DNA helicase PcrA
MLALTQYAYGEVDWSTVSVAFGTYLTACSRGPVPPLARALAAGSPLPPVLHERVDNLRAAATTAAATSLSDVAEIAATAWASTGISGGEAPWERTAPSFKALARQSARGPATQTANLVNAINDLRVGAMFESQRHRLPAVQVMNLHQTKGREADAVVILCADDDFHGHEDEPFVEGSRLLYVILTRARREVTVLLGHDPHPLVSPIAILGRLGGGHGALGAQHLS